MSLRFACAFAALVASLIGAERLAESCDCDPQGRSIPGDGATDAPLNTRLVVRSQYKDRWTNPRLVRTSDGVAVTADIRRRDRPNSWDRHYFVTPVADLEPETTYQFIRDTNGGLVEVESTFTTGTHRLTEPPSFGGLSELTLDTIHVSDVPQERQTSCFGALGGWHSRVLSSGGDRGDSVAYVESRGPAGWWRA